jgi:hypothetical protein
MNTIVDGCINIVMTQKNDCIVDVAISSSRSQIAQRLLAGHTPEKAFELVRIIFSLCGKAQGVASQTACDAALGRFPNATELKTREIGVLIELVLENARCLAMDWPKYNKEVGGVDLKGLIALRKSSTNNIDLFETLANFVAESLLGESPHTWITRDFSELIDWIELSEMPLARLFADLLSTQDVDTSQVVLLPTIQDMNDAMLQNLALSALNTPNFCMRPLWDSQVAETGALSRMRDHPMLLEWILNKGCGIGARMLARLLELVQITMSIGFETGWLVRSKSLGEGAGIAVVETSRGVLIHTVQLRSNVVSEYRIIAPTEWNFHPKGVLVNALKSLNVREDIESYAKLFCQILDPCVAYNLELNYA